MNIVSYSHYSNGNMQLLTDSTTETTTNSTDVVKTLGKISGVSKIFADDRVGEIKISFDEAQINGRKLLRLLGYLGS